MKRSTAELTVRAAQLQHEIQMLREQLATWKNDPPKAIQGNYPTKYALHQAIYQRNLEGNLIVRQLQSTQEE